MRLNVIIFIVSLFLGLAYGSADVVNYATQRALYKALIALCPELDYEARIRESDENRVRILLERRGYVWEPILGRSADEILKKWKKPLSVSQDKGVPGLEGDWSAPSENWQYDGYYLLFNQQHRCFYVCEDDIWH